MGLGQIGTRGHFARECKNKLNKYRQRVRGNSDGKNKQQKLKKKTFSDGEKVFSCKSNPLCIY